MTKGNRWWAKYFADTVFGMDDKPDIPGGAQTVCHWIETLERADQPEGLWSSLDENLRLVLAQQWLFALGPQDFSGDAIVRDQFAENLAGSISHELFDPMIWDYIVHWRVVYQDLDYQPAMVMMPDLVGVDLEAVTVTSNRYAGTKVAGESIPGHTFLTRLVDGRWRIASLSRRIPVPGWPPTEVDVPGLRVDDS